MRLISSLEDQRIKSHNVLVEFTIQEYLEMATAILKNNPFQRKRVKSSSSVYTLLRDDLKAGCIIPPIVLAITQETFILNSKTDLDSQSSSFSAFLKQNIKHVIILDGLQRTYNIIDAETELKDVNDDEGLSKYYNNKLRCEFYLGIDKIGILYRMLTLNTGQTPMSLRHQVEILYSDYLNTGVDGIHLVREIDERLARKPGEYSFKEIIEGFTSYLLRDYLTLDRSDILENIKSLEKLSKENQGFDIFKNFTKSYHNFQTKIQALCGNWEFDQENSDLELSAAPYGKNAKSIFDKSQSMTGLGAAIGFLKDKDLIAGFDELLVSINKIHFAAGGPNSAITNLLYKLDDIRKSAAKIGNAQRAYFYYFYRELFNKEGDSYLLIDEAIENAFKRYRQNA
jgi:hypothetical protein